MTGGTILLFVDIPSVVMILASWWLFRMASGKRRRGIGAPVAVDYPVRNTNTVNRTLPIFAPIFCR